MSNSKHNAARVLKSCMRAAVNKSTVLQVQYDEFCFSHLTIFFQIASPFAGDALAVGAGEEVGSAGGPVAVCFVTPVTAVVVEVTTPQLRNAFFSVRTSKLN